MMYDDIDHLPQSGGSVKLSAFWSYKRECGAPVAWKVKDGCDNVDICQAKIPMVDKKHQHHIVLVYIQQFCNQIPNS